MAVLCRQAEGEWQPLFTEVGVDGQQILRINRDAPPLPRHLLPAVGGSVLVSFLGALAWDFYAAKTILLAAQPQERRITSRSVFFSGIALSSVAIAIIAYRQRTVVLQCDNRCAAGIDDRAPDCPICVEEHTSRWALADCGHLICHNCFLQLHRAVCPFCQRTITQHPILLFFQ